MLSSFGPKLVNIYVAKRNQEREGKSREGQGMEGKSREGKGREEQGSYLQPSPTSVHTLHIPIWTPPVPVSILPPLVYIYPSTPEGA